MSEQAMVSTLLPAISTCPSPWPASFAPGFLANAALTATPAGKRTFEKLGFAPTGYKELFVTKDSENRKQAGRDKQPLGMIWLYPGDERDPREAVEGGAVVSRSEMVVKYGSPSRLVRSWLA